MNERPVQPDAAGLPQRFSHAAMACTFELFLAGGSPRRAAQAAAAAFGEVDRLEQLLSRFIPHSEIVQISALRPGQSLRVAPDTAECLQLANQLYTASHGAFDVAFRSAPAVRAALHEQSTPPLAFDPVHHTIGVQVAGVSLDLGGLGKGYAVDRVVALLREWGVPAALVHSGQSSAYAFGRGPDDGPWRVALRDPLRPERVLARLELRGAALGGSGQRLHGGHIVDPRTGRPADRVQAAWALAPTAAVADGLSTAFLVMAEKEIAELCRQSPGVTAILFPALDPAAGLRTFGVAAPFVEASSVNPESRS